MYGSLSREKILDEARRQLARFGIRKTSLADITRPLGVSKTAVYHHFPGGKREIIEAVLEREEAVVLERMREAVAAEDDPRRQLRSLALAKLRHLQELKEMLNISRPVGDELSRLYAQHERRFNAAERELIAEILKRGQETGLFRPSGVETLAGVLQSAQTKLSADLVFHTDRRDVERRVDELLEVLFYGIVAPGAGRPGEAT